MSELIHVRPAEKDRPKPPTVHDDDVTLEKPPESPRGSTSKGAVAGPILLVLAIAGMMYVGFKNGRMFTGYGLTLPLMLVFGGAAMFRRQRGGGASSADIGRERANYARYIDVRRDAAIASARTQFEFAQFHYPPPGELAGRIGPGRRPEDDDKGKPKPSDRMWERRRGDRSERSAFGKVRIGLGTERARMKYSQLELGALIDQEPACGQMVGDFIAEHSFVRDIPRALTVTEQPGWFCVGDLDAARASVRAMLMHAAFFHAPQDLGIAVITDPERAAAWDWVKWLRHHHSETSHRPMTFGAASDFVASMGQVYSDRGAFRSGSMRGSTLSDAAGGDGAAAQAGSAGPRPLLVVCDSGALDWSELLRDGQESGVEGVCFLVVGESDSPMRSAMSTLVYVGPQEVRRSETESGPPEFLAVPDQVSVWEAEAFARRMAAYRPGTKASRLLDEAGERGGPRLGSLIGIDDWARFDPKETWKWAGTRRNLLRVPVGQYIDSGRPWFLDVSEDAGAHGPHIGLGGSTGSGKSEFLRVLVLALCCTHSPQDLVIMPADFKGNITFRGFEALPHVPMVLHNLESSADSIGRLIQVYMGELERRQHLLDHCGDLAASGAISRAPANIDEYRALRVKRPDLGLEPMPHVLIPFDELMQAKRAYPELLGMIRIMGTVGRSLGVHLLPVSQTLDDSLMAGINTHLTARIGLRMNDPRDYRPVIGTSNPGALPNRKGVGYFVPNLESPAQRIQVAYVSGTYVPPTPPQAEQVEQAAAGQVRPRLLSAFGDAAAEAIERSYGGTELVADDQATQADDEPVDELDDDGSDGDDEDSEEDISSTDMGVAIEVLRGHGCLDHNPWKPELLDYRPLADAVAQYVSELRPELAAGGLAGDQHPGRQLPALLAGFGPAPLDLKVPCGVVDRPREHTQSALTVDLSTNTGLAGAQKSGKSFALLSILMGAAALYPPERMQFYAIDLGGGQLAWLRDLQHMGAVISGSGEVYEVQRMISHLDHLVRRRGAQWPAAGITSVDQWRRLRFGTGAAAAPNGDTGRREPTTAPDDGYGDVYLVINGFDKFVAAFGEHMETFGNIAREGPDKGVHVLVTVNSWQAAHTFQLWRDWINTRYELRMDDPTSSLMPSSVAQSVPHIPGRGMIPVAGAGRARRGVIQAGGADMVPPEPVAWHVLYAAPEIVTPDGLRVSAQDNGFEVAKYLNSLHPSGYRAPDFPALPTSIEASSIKADPSRGLLLGIQETDLSPFYWAPEQTPHLAIVGDSETGRTTTLELLGRQLQQRIDTAPPDRKPVVVVFDQRQDLAGVIPGADYVYLGSQVPAAVAKVNEIMATRNADTELTQEQIAARRDQGNRFDGPEVFVIIDNLTDFLAQGDPFGWDQYIEKGAFIGFHVIVSRIADQTVTAAWANRGVMAAVGRSNSPVLLMSTPVGLMNIVGKLRGQQLPKGRGLVVERGSAKAMIQVALPANRTVST